jgi:hypothetical protein
MQQSKRLQTQFFSFLFNIKTVNVMKNLVLFFTLCIVLNSCEKAFPEYAVADIPTDFTPLVKPEPGKGYQMHIQPFPVPANFEREIYVRKLLGNTEEVYLNGFEMKARAGTHHMIAYSFGKDDKLPPLDVLYDQNMPNNTLASRAFKSSGGQVFQSPSADYKFKLPEGYAIKMPANSSFWMNSHYFNKTDKTRFGELYVNYYTTPKSDVRQELKVDYLAPDDIELPAGKETVLTTTFKMEKETVIPMILSHYHKLGKKFEVRIQGGSRDGEMIYYSEDYENPVLKVFSPALVLKPGESLISKVTYMNNTNQLVKFGLTSNDEMNYLISFNFEK